jgi:hypothetical protein
VSLDGRRRKRGLVKSCRHAVLPKGDFPGMPGRHGGEARHGVPSELSGSRSLLIMGSPRHSLGVLGASAMPNRTCFVVLGQVLDPVKSHML